MVVFGLGEGHCFSPVVVGVDLGIAFVDCVIAFFAFCQLWRIHSRSQQLGWTRQKVFHFLTGCSSFGYCAYFILTLAATCSGWKFWSPYSFVLMVLPEILFFTSFLLLLSFWIDLCHQANDEDEDEECSSHVSLLQSPLAKPGSSSSDGQARCLPFHYFRVGSRQSIVVLAACLISALMVVVAILMGVGGGTVYSELIPKIFVCLLAILVFSLGAALAYYGFLICLRMRRVRSESSSSEMWKVGGLSVVSPLCFTMSSVIALLPDSPILYHFQEQRNDSAYLLVLLILYYIIGSSVPSAFLLWVMRELPQPIPPALREERETIVFIRDSSVSIHRPPQWTTALSSQNQVPFFSRKNIRLYLSETLIMVRYFPGSDHHRRREPAPYERQPFQTTVTSPCFDDQRHVCYKRMASLPIERGNCKKCTRFNGGKQCLVLYVLDVGSNQSSSLESASWDRQGDDVRSGLGSD